MTKPDPNRKEKKNYLRNVDRINTLVAEGQGLSIRRCKLKVPVYLEYDPAQNLTLLLSHLIRRDKIRSEQNRGYKNSIQSGEVTPEKMLAKLVEKHSVTGCFDVDLETLAETVPQRYSNIGRDGYSEMYKHFVLSSQEVAGAKTIEESIDAVKVRTELFFRLCPFISENLKYKDISAEGFSDDERIDFEKTTLVIVDKICANLLEIVKEITD